MENGEEKVTGGWGWGLQWRKNPAVGEKIRFGGRSKQCLLNMTVESGCKLKMVIFFMESKS